MEDSGSVLQCEIGLSNGISDLVVRKDTTVKVHINEIAVLLIETTAVSMTVRV